MRIYLLIGQIVKNFYDYSAEYATKIKNTVFFFFFFGTKMHISSNNHKYLKKVRNKWWYFHKIKDMTC